MESKKNNFDMVVNLTEKQAEIRYNIGREYLNSLSEEIGACFYVGRKRLYNKKKLDKYFEEIGEYKPQKWGRV